MALNLKKILGLVTDVVPLGSTVKSLLKGASNLLVKKAAKAVGIKEEKVEELLVEASKLAEYDHEIKTLLIKEEQDRRVHELAVFGKFAELDAGSQKMVARIRPLLSFGLVGTYMLYCLSYLVAQLFPYLTGFEVPAVIPPSLIKVTLWICGFWFLGRSFEKGMAIYKNGK